MDLDGYQADPYKQPVYSRTIQSGNLWQSKHYMAYPLVCLYNRISCIRISNGQPPPPGGGYMSNKIYTAGINRRTLLMSTVASTGLLLQVGTSGVYAQQSLPRHTLEKMPGLDTPSTQTGDRVVITTTGAERLGQRKLEAITIG